MWLVFTASHNELQGGIDRLSNEEIIIQMKEIIVSCHQLLLDDDDDSQDQLRLSSSHQLTPDVN